MTTDTEYTNETHIVEEVPGVPNNERYFVWHNKKVVFKAETKVECEKWAIDNNIVVKAFYPFEP